MRNATVAGAASADVRKEVGVASSMAALLLLSNCLAVIQNNVLGLYRFNEYVRSCL